MQPCLSHLSAWRFLMRTPNERTARRLPTDAQLAPPYAPTRPNMRTLSELLESDGPVDILVSRDCGRRSDGFTRSRLATDPLPPGSIRPIELPDGSKALCVSPELLFLQCAATMTFAQTVYIGHSLCSSYRMASTTPGGIEQRTGKDKPLTCIDSIEYYLGQVKGAKGAAKARDAVRFIRESSRSPMESALAMGYGMPHRHGGFGCGEITLNKPISIFEGNEYGERRYTTRIPDLTIEAQGRDGAKRKVLLDYDADSLHATRTRLARDSARRNQIATTGVAAHISMTSAQAMEFGSYAHIAEQIRISLKRQNPLRISTTSKDLAVLAKLEDVRARRFALWKEIVCFSDFRKLE